MSNAVTKPFKQRVRIIAELTALPFWRFCFNAMNRLWAPFQSCKPPEHDKQTAPAVERGPKLRALTADPDLKLPHDLRQTTKLALLQDLTPRTLEAPEGGDSMSKPSIFLVQPSRTRPCMHGCCVLF